MNDFRQGSSRASNSTLIELEDHQSGRGRSSIKHGIQPAEFITITNPSHACPGMLITINRSQPPANGHAQQTISPVPQVQPSGMFSPTLYSHALKTHTPGVAYALRTSPDPKVIANPIIPTATATKYRFELDKIRAESSRVASVFYHKYTHCGYCGLSMTPVPFRVKKKSQVHLTLRYS